MELNLIAKDGSWGQARASRVPETRRGARLLRRSHCDDLAMHTSVRDDHVLECLLRYINTSTPWNEVTRVSLRRDHQIRIDAPTTAL
jgi:hypothetical protein